MWACKLKYFYLCASGAITSFYATVESSAMFCITIQRNIMLKLNCSCAYYDTAEHNLLHILLLRTTLAPYWQSLVHLNCACVYYNTLLLHKIEKIKMAGSIREMSKVRWTIITAILTFSDWIRVYAVKLVNAPKSHKIEYVPMHTIWEITRLA